jgi:hypothetical protein
MFILYPLLRDTLLLTVLGVCGVSRHAIVIYLFEPLDPEARSRHTAA